VEGSVADVCQISALRPPTCNPGIFHAMIAKIPSRVSLSLEAGRRPFRGAATSPPSADNLSTGPKRACPAAFLDPAAAHAGPLPSVVADFLFPCSHGTGWIVWKKLRKSECLDVKTTYDGELCNTCG